MDFEEEYTERLEDSGLEDLEAQLAEVREEIQSVKTQLNTPFSIKAGAIAAILGYYGSKKYLGLKGDSANILAIGLGVAAGKFASAYDHDPSYKQQLAEYLVELEQMEKTIQIQIKGAINGHLSADDIAQMNFKKMGFDGKWKQLIGDPDINPAKGWHIMVFGVPKSGKSIMCYQLADYLTKWGSVGYISAEEGTGSTVSLKAKNWINNGSNVFFVGAKRMSAIAEALKNGKYKFVIIDSINFAKLTVDDVEELKELSPKTNFITIFQSTKDGEFRGEQEYAHNCDAIIKVERGGKATCVGRFNEGHGETNVFNGSDPEETEDTDTQSVDLD